MDLQQTIEHWKKLSRAAVHGASTALPKGLYAGNETDGYKLVGMQVDGDTLNELVAIQTAKEKLEREAKMQAARQSKLPASDRPRT